MAGLQRFITYIYKYEEDEKKENAGFAKIEIRGTVCRMEIHIRNCIMETTEPTVYLFTRNKDVMLGVPVGNMQISRGNADVRYSFDIKELSNLGLDIKDMEGIYIPDGENCYLASQWKEGIISKKHFRIFDKEETDEPEEPEEDILMESQEKTGSQQDSKIQATELPLEDFLEETSWDTVFQKLRLKLNVFYPFEGKEIECVRMQLNDLQELPKKYWHIGNNSFLLHGFFNYRHIIMGNYMENGKKVSFIGVPGVFTNQERIMATMFGFPEFRTAKPTEYKTGNFGYWYRII